MNSEYKIVKGNKVHKTAIINWEKIIIGKGNVFFPYSIIGTDAQHSYEKTNGKLIIVPLDMLPLLPPYEE